MKCYCNRYGSKLLLIPLAGAVTVTTDGKAARVLPDQTDGQTDANQDYRFVTTLNVVGGSGSPAVTLIIQGSADGTTWVDVAAGTVRTAPGLYTEIIDNANSQLLPWIRVRVVVAGTTPPAADCSVDIVSTGPFQLSGL